MNGTYPSSLWNGLGVAVLVAVVVGIVLYAPLIAALSLTIILVVFVVAAALYGMIFDVEVSDNPKQEDEKT